LLENLVTAVTFFGSGVTGVSFHLKSCFPFTPGAEQVAADAAKGQGGEEESKADDQLIRDETFEVGVAQFPWLTDIGRENNEGGKAEKAEADALQQPEGGGTQMSAV
jgi:hypothetical protein